MKESNRQRKFARVIQKEMSEIFQKEISIPGSPMVTVTVVRATPDLRIVRVYTSVFPDAQGPETVAYLRETVRETRHLLAQRIRKQVRYIPDLEFFLDDTLQEVEKMDRLFDQIKPSQEEE